MFGCFKTGVFHPNGKTLSTTTVISTVDDEKHTEVSEEEDKHGFARMLTDWRSVCILLFLYTLQGLPLGLAGSIPLIIQERNVTYSEQAKFSLAGWPFSLKLLWAPLVDAIYFRRIGRRKSWLIPVQYLIGGTMLFLSFWVDHLLDSLQIGVLTGFFFFLNFLTATQDVAVDGWALTMLKKENVGLASTCNAVGQSFGAFIGYAVFINLNSPSFSNKWFRTVPNNEVGIVTLASFMGIWSIIYFVCTTLLLIFKNEEDEPGAENGDGEKNNNSIVSSYLRLWDILKLPSVRKCVLFYFTSSLGFAAVHALSELKFVEAGLPKEVKAQLSVPLIPISLLVPVLVSKWTVGVKPMSLFMKVYIFALLTTGVIAGMVWVTGEVKDDHGGFPSWYVPTLLAVEAILKIVETIMFVAKMAFVARISDPAHGATFMTMYNTVSNLGSAWPRAAALWLVDPLTFKSCPSNESGSLCTTTFDGYYVETIACIVIGLVWFLWGNVTIKKLQKKPETVWKLEKK